MSRERPSMGMNDIFFDSSALIAGIVSAQGAARALLLLAEDEKIQITVSEQVIAEVERNIARKAPKAVPFARELILRANIRILRDPSIEEVLPAPGLDQPFRRCTHFGRRSARQSRLPGDLEHEAFHR